MSIPQHTKESPYCIIWDCDGTLIDTEVASAAVIAGIMEKTKPGTGKLEAQHHNSLIGLPTEKWIEMMMNVADLHGLIDPLAFAEEYTIQMTNASSHFAKTKGADALTRFFFENGIKQVMATSTPRNLIGAKLSSHNEMINRFESIVTADDVKHGKPAPDIFLKAAEIAGIPADHCIVFEDSPFGVEGALTAGMYAIAVDTGRIALDRFKGASQIVKDLTQFDSEMFGFAKFTYKEE